MLPAKVLLGKGYVSGAGHTQAEARRLFSLMRHYLCYPRFQLAYLLASVSLPNENTNCHTRWGSSQQQEIDILEKSKVTSGEEDSAASTRGRG